MPQEPAGAGGLDVIIVTAQKREQSLQDVPIAVTALGEEALEANRVATVSDLSGLAPGFTVRTASGGANIPLFSARGVSSRGLIIGTDKQISIYLDGVYISSPRGSIFDLPDVQRIEVLRGPQGTLFGRNATAGAVSVSTRDPAGDPQVKARFTLGNRDHYRWGLSAETPEMGPFSAYFSYVHEEREGDLRNLGTPVAWDFGVSEIPRAAEVKRSAEYLGSKDSDSYFAALKFESGDFKSVYKYDRNELSGTPEATALLAVNRNAPLVGNFLGALIDSNGVQTADPTGKRPDGVYNSWAVPIDQVNQGHSLTSTFIASDSLSIKSILGYRKSRVIASSPIDGISALTFTPQALVPYATFAGIRSLAARGVDVTNPANGLLIQRTIGQVAGQASNFIGEPFLALASYNEARSKQWSAEVQANYESDLVTATVGALWFKSKDWISEGGIPSTLQFAFAPGGVIQPPRTYSEPFAQANSYAGYAQAEIHLTPELDIIVGGRLTHDRKDGSFRYGSTAAPAQVVTYDYSDTKFNYLLGVNYSPTDDLLLYAKYSTAYVSGGSVGGIPFSPETVKSAETGVKAELFDRALRTNLALWWADTENQQSTGSSLVTPGLSELLAPGNPANPFLGVYVVDAGNLESYGFEFDFDAAPVRGVTLGASLGYTHISVSDVNPAYVTAYNGFYDGRQNIPKWNGAVYAQYESPPLFGDSYLSIRGDGIYTGRVKVDYDPGQGVWQAAPEAFSISSYWVFNGRVALRDIDLGGVNAELAFWGRNLFDKEQFSYGLNLGDLVASGNYIPARSYGVDLTVSF